MLTIHKKLTIPVHQNIPLQNVLISKENSPQQILVDRENICSRHRTKEISIQVHNLYHSILHKRNKFQRSKISENLKWNKLKRFKDCKKWNKWHWIIWKLAVVVEQSGQLSYIAKRHHLRIFTQKLQKRTFPI